MPNNIVRIPVNLDYAKRGDPTTLAFLRQSLARKIAEAQAEESLPWESVFPEEAESASQTERTCEDSDSSPH